MSFTADRRSIWRRPHMKRGAARETASWLQRQHGRQLAPPVVQDVLQASGHPLDTTTRGIMEQRLGHDFSSVRVHDDAQAAQSAHAVAARAFTVGQDVVFGPDQYTPGSPAGQQLIAHELVHTVQQQGARYDGPMNIERSPSSAESEAQASAKTVMRGDPARLTARIGTLAIQRDGESMLGVSSLRLDPDIEAQIRAIEMMNRMLTPGYIASASSVAPTISLGTAGLTLSPPGGGSRTPGTSPLGVPPLRLGPAPTLPSPTLPTPQSTPPWLSPTPSTMPAPLVPPGAGPATSRAASAGDLFRALMRVPAISSAITTLRTEAASRARSEWNQLNTGERALVISHTALLGAGALAGVLSSPEGREFTLDMLQDRDLPVPGVPGLNFRFNVTGPNQQLFLNLDLAQLIPALRR